MFGFGKKKKKQQEAEQKAEQDQKKKKGRVEKLVMGAIVGAAVGSVIGMSIAPKKGKETRKLIEDKGKEVIEKGKKIIEETKSEIEPKLQKEKSPKKGLFTQLKTKLQGSRMKKKQSDKQPKSDQEELEDILKKIPNEQA